MDEKSGNRVARSQVQILVDRIVVVVVSVVDEE